MKILLPLILLAAGAFAAMAQTQAAQQETVALKIIRFKWIKLPPNDPKLQEIQNAAVDAQIEEEMRKEPRNYQVIDALRRRKQAQTFRPGVNDAANKSYQYRLRVRNTGSKTVTGLRWVYNFNDPVTHKKILRHSFESKAEIGPGKEKEVTIYTDSAPPNIINVKAKVDKKGSAWEEAVVIESVQFSDGSSWLRN